MKRMMSLAALLVTAPVWATTYTWVGGETGKWNERTSFSPDPGEGFTGNFAADDEVQVPDNQTVKISSADEDSWTALNRLKRIQPMGTKSVLEITVDSGTAEFLPAFTYAGMDSTHQNGTIRKLGLGTLELKSTTRYTSGKWDYYATYKIDEGTLKLPSVGTGTFYLFYGVITVGENGTLQTVSSTSGSGAAYTCCRGLKGTGVITNVNNGGGTQYLQPHYESGCYEFGGKITGAVSLFVRGSIDLTGTESTYNGATYYQDSNYGVRLGVAKFGNKDATASSIGSQVTIMTRDYAGRLLYLGQGETTDRTFYWAAGTSGKKYDNWFSGGLYGNLKLTGNWYHRENTDNWYLNHLVLAGTNELGACEMRGPIGNCSYTSGGVTHVNPFYLHKRDPGQWNLLGSRVFGGGIAVEDGILGFDSLAEAGVACSLGKADMLTAAETYGNYADVAHVDYAYTLGSANASACGMMEYLATTDVVVRTRSTVLKGRGGFKTDDARLRMNGVSTLAESTTLVLAGAGTKENQVANVVPAANQTVSIEKQGAGTWTLAENIGVNGSVKAKGGRLVLNNSNRYRWFRWVILGKMNNGEAHTSVSELGLFDAEGHRLNVACGIRANDTTDFTYLQAGSAMWGKTLSVADDWSSTRCALSRMFGDDNLITEMYFKGSSKIKLDNTEANAVVIVMRVPDDAPTVASWDWVAGYSQSANNGKERTPSTYHFDASVDGQNWVTITTVNGATTYEGGKWAFGGESYTAGKAATTVHTTGSAIPEGPTGSAYALPSSLGTVGFAQGAELVFSGIAAPISKIELDGALGMGTLSGATLADDGQLVLTNVPQSSQSNFTYTFKNVTNADAFKDWSVVDVAGNPTKCMVTIGDGTITIQRCPLLIIFK